MKTVPRWHIRRWMAALIVVESVMLAAAIIGGVIGLNQLSDARARVVDQIDPELIEAQNLTSALLNQETGLRGYLLTGQRDFLTPFDDGRAQQDKAVAELRRLGAVDGTQAGDELTRVLNSATVWQATAQEMIAAPRPVDQALVDSGKSQFDAVRTLLTAQSASLRAGREGDRERLNESARLLSVVIGVIIVLLVVLFVLLALGFQRRIMAPILRLGNEVKAATADIDHRIVGSEGPHELAELAADVEAMRQRIVNEVSELRRAHRLLDERTQELQRSNSDLEQFAYVASHDLQEPLRKVTSFCQLIQHRYQGQLDERGEQYIEFAVDGARRMQVLINDLLAFSRVGRGTGEFTDVSTGEALRAAIGNLEQVIEETGAEVTLTGLPVVRGEISLLTTVFQNLLSNAIKFRGDEPPAVRVKAALDAGQWTFSVTDNGIGIDPEYADRIFVIFQRLHTRAAYPGTGIGLAMARKIIEYHGGRIWLDTDSGPGRTTFRFTLPQRTEES
ncbi:signal transduction histidine kinase [Kibdelosporangium banguiense]|uniref:histidine kinase n=1 Tax=Kibdelosporangium banguiense TaxID=1365924 RepID=A0ABS4U0U4_9PSEU|nr:sensor histidine kinase [Kibdelosporangium banguiense]MBP2329858.1 signal transduction histidine kinase [Kibdelosporangium banguiense]